MRLALGSLDAHDHNHPRTRSNAQRLNAGIRKLHHPHALSAHLTPEELVEILDFDSYSAYLETKKRLGNPTTSSGRLQNHHIVRLTENLTRFEKFLDELWLQANALTVIAQRQHTLGNNEAVTEILGTPLLNRDGSLHPRAREVEDKYAR